MPMTQSLTPKQELFCQKYIETGNASEAYRLAYDVSPSTKPNTIHRKAHEVLENGKVAARVEELKAARLKKHEVTVDRVLKEYARLGFFDPRKLFDEDGNLIPIHLLDDDTAAAVASLEIEEIRRPIDVDEELEGQPHGGSLRRSRGVAGHVKKVKLWNKTSALDSLAKHLGMFKEQVEVTGKDGGPIVTEDRSAMETARRLAFLLTRAAQDKPKSDS